MKLTRSKQVHYDSGPNMTPLVDVVMVILIFLMLAGSFAGAEHYLAMEPTVGQTAKAPTPGSVAIGNDLDVFVDSPSPDRFIARAGRYNVSDGSSLTAQLTRMRRAMSNDDNDRPDLQTRVVIRPGRNVKYKYLIDVY